LKLISASGCGNVEPKRLERKAELLIVDDKNVVPAEARI
jgi:hypothetical protein